MSNKGFDEYGYYGDNNAPLSSKAAQLKDTECPPIRDMTEEERKASIEREKANSVVSTDKEPFALGLERIKEYEDGSADYKIHMSDEAKESIFDYGLQFILYCAASNMDIQDALDGILKQGGNDD